MTDDEILELWSPHGRPVLGRNKILAFARAVEARERERAERLAKALRGLMPYIDENMADFADVISARAVLSADAP